MKNADKIPRILIYRRKKQILAILIFRFLLILTRFLEVINNANENI